VRCIVLEHDQEKRGRRPVPGLTHLVWILFDYTLTFKCVTHKGCAQSHKLQEWEDMILKISGTSLTRLVTIHNAKLEKSISESPKEKKNVSLCLQCFCFRTLSI
jgi:hypothetical protein